MRKNYKGFIRHPGSRLIAGGTFVFLLCISLYSFSQGDIWQQKQSLGLAAPARYQAVSFSIGDKGYAGTGIGLSDFWAYDPVTDVWTQKANVPGGPRSSATAFNIGSKGYIGLGDSASFIAHYSDFYEYDPITNVWTRKADFGGGGRSGAAGFSIGTKGYLGTGSVNDLISTNDFWEFDPVNNVWTQKANFAGGVRNSASGLQIGNKGYIGLGRKSILPIELYDDFWEYDPATDIWMQKAGFAGGARFGATGFSIGNKGYLGTGNTSFFSQNDFWEFDPATNIWVKKANFGGSVREQAISFSIGTKGYIGTGYRSTNEYTFGPKDDFWEYDIVSDTWTQKANFGGGVRMYAVGFGIMDKGYVGTGYDGGPKKDFWEFDPATGLWIQKADFAGGERREATGFGIGNKGFVGQGYARGRNTFVNDFWQYDPGANTWQQGSAPFLLARAGATFFTIGSKEYFGMGYYFATDLYDFWEFDPATGVWTQKADYLPGHSGAGFGVGNKGYLFGTYFWEYDPATNLWTQKAGPDPGKPFLFLFGLKNKAYLLTNDHELWEYDVTNDSLVHRANFPGLTREGATAFSIGDKGYFGFGRTTNGFTNDFWEYTPPSENAITAIVSPTTFCSGSTGMVSYTAKGVYNAGNIFSAELSDSVGNFSLPKIIGTDTSIASGVINITMPANISAGQAYRIRVVSSSPVVTDSENNDNLIINPSPVARARDLTVYLNERGIASISPAEVDSGSTAYCGSLKFTLDDTRFNCQNIGFKKVKLTVTDRNGSMASDTALITVLDTLKPRIWNAFATPNNLWPPNQQMIKVTIEYQANDNCSIASKSLSVTSNELQTGSSADWQILDAHHLLLRSEINEGRNKERIYIVTITVKDYSGNLDTEVVKVVVSRHRDDDHWSAPWKHGLIVRVIPNPTRQFFTLLFNSNSNQPVIIKVTDVWGRVIERRTQSGANGVLQIGNDYRPGIYHAEVRQGKDRVTLQLIKLSK